jgi:hypothetical protein
MSNNNSEIEKVSVMASRGSPLLGAATLFWIFD